MQWFTEGPAVEAHPGLGRPAGAASPRGDRRRALHRRRGHRQRPLGRAIAQGAERIFVLLCGPLRYTPHRYRRPIEAVLTAFFIAIHAKFARELEPTFPPAWRSSSSPSTPSRCRAMTTSRAPMRYLAAGRANADTVLDFWERGGIGDTLGTVRPAPVEAVTPSDRPGAVLSVAESTTGPSGEAGAG